MSVVNRAVAPSGAIAEAVLRVRGCPLFDCEGRAIVVALQITTVAREADSPKAHAAATLGWASRRDGIEELPRLRNSHQYLLNQNRRLRSVRSSAASENSQERLLYRYHPAPHGVCQTGGNASGFRLRST
jgi:hypothetical protein